MPELSILRQVKNPSRYPALFYLSELYERFTFHRAWTFGRQAELRRPQKADRRNDKLEERGLNLGMVLSRLRRESTSKNKLIEGVRQLYSGIDDFEIAAIAGYVEIIFQESVGTIPANRLSDGTLRYLCLLAILCDPEPPPLICIEEPELGLHPDLMPTIARLLRDAATRTQLVVTTHSDILVDAFTEDPECVVVCDKHEGQTQMERLDAKELAVWLEDYRLGTLWLKGGCGGVRW